MSYDPVGSIRTPLAVPKVVDASAGRLPRATLPSSPELEVQLQNVRTTGEELEENQQVTYKFGQTSSRLRRTADFLSGGALVVCVAAKNRYRTRGASEDLFSRKVRAEVLGTSFRN